MIENHMASRTAIRLPNMASCSVANTVERCLNRHAAITAFVSGEHGRVSLCFMGTPPPIEIASLGMADSLILMVLALVVFGPRRLPQIGRQIGKLMYEFRKASNDFKFQMEEELRVAEEADRRKKEEAERQRNLALTAPAAASQAIEAEAGIGAGESPLASSYPGEGNYPAAYPAEGPAAELPVVTIPRIQPPSTGEQVTAAPPTSVAPPEASAEPDEAAPADSEPAANAFQIEPPPPQTTSQTETVSQHG